MVTRTTFKSNKGKEYKCITIFEIIHQGPQDNIIYYIQNEKSWCQWWKFFNVIPMKPHFETVKNPDFWKTQ